MPCSKQGNKVRVYIKSFGDFICTMLANKGEFRPSDMHLLQVFSCTKVKDASSTGLEKHDTILIRVSKSLVTL